METTATIFSTWSHNGQKQLRRIGLAAIVILWLAAVLVGIAAMMDYEFSSGEDPRAPALWPTDSGISRTAGHPTVLVFAHPRCPCTEATLDELAEIVAATDAGADIKVLFFRPGNAGADWTQSRSVSRTAAMPDVQIISDENGREAQLFHAVTSGRTLLYDAAGHLLFDGGITGSRGHAGENAGSKAVRELLTQGSHIRSTTPVFGCSILENDTQCD